MHRTLRYTCGIVILLYAWAFDVHAEFEDVDDSVHAEGESFADSASTELHQMADHLLGQRFDAAVAISTGLVESFASEEAQGWHDAVSSVAQMPKLIEDSFREQRGRDVEVTLSSRQQVVRILDVDARGVIQAERIFRGARANVQFRIRDLDVGERFRRVGQQETPDRQIMRGLLAVEAERPDVAKNFFHAAGSPLGELLAGRIRDVKDSQQMQHLSRAAERDFRDMLRQAGIGTAWNTEEELVLALRQANLWERNIHRLHQQVAAFRQRYGYVETAERYGRALELMEKLVPRFPLYISEERLATVLEQLKRDNPGPFAIQHEASIEDCGVVLDLSGNRQLSSIAALKGLPITTLDISNTLVTDLEPLRGIPTMRILNLAHTRIRDLTPLQGMQLRELDLTYAPFGISDLEPLRGMALEKLNISKLPSSVFRDLSVLEGMPLRWLDASGQRGLLDISSLAGMPLKWLRLVGCLSLRDISPLKGMELEYLSLRVTAVTDISPLKGMKLEHLDLRETSVTDFSPLVDLDLEKTELLR